MHANDLAGETVTGELGRSLVCANGGELECTGIESFDSFPDDESSDVSMADSFAGVQSSSCSSAITTRSLSEFVLVVRVSPASVLCCSVVGRAQNMFGCQDSGGACWRILVPTKSSSFQVPQHSALYSV